MLVLDAGGVSRLAEVSTRGVALLRELRASGGLWPPVVPSIVIVESVTGTARDARVNRLLTACDVVTDLPERVARRAGQLRALARKGSAVDAVVVASAEPDGVVLTGDVEDLTALATYAEGVVVMGA